MDFVKFEVTKLVALTCLSSCNCFKISIHRGISMYVCFDIVQTVSQRYYNYEYLHCVLAAHHHCCPNAHIDLLLQQLKSSQTSVSELIGMVLQGAAAHLVFAAVVEKAF